MPRLHTSMTASRSGVTLYLYHVSTNQYCYYMKVQCAAIINSHSPLATIQSNTAPSNSNPRTDGAHLALNTVSRISRLSYSYSSKLWAVGQKSAKFNSAMSIPTPLHMNWFIICLNYYMFMPSRAGVPVAFIICESSASTSKLSQFLRDPILYI